jgi:hypothetical protein
MRSGLAGLATCADYFHAAAMYEALRGLSPAELERRGFSRGSWPAICAAWMTTP